MQLDLEATETLGQRFRLVGLGEGRVDELGQVALGQRRVALGLGGELVELVLGEKEIRFGVLGELRHQGAHLERSTHVYVLLDADIDGSTVVDGRLVGVVGQLGRAPEQR